MKSLKSLAILTVLLCSTASADTVVELKYLNAMSQILTNGEMARINTRGSDDYMLIDFNKNSVYSVTPDKQQIFNMSDSMPSISGMLSPQTRVKLKPLGKGPNVAGYATTRYRLSANGEFCGSVYASREALKDTAVVDAFDSISTMAKNHRQSLGGFAALLPVCQLAQIELANKLHKIGAPMRIVDKQGRTETEVTKILKNARVEPRYYAFPSTYKTISIIDKLENALKQTLESDDTQKSADKRQHSKQPKYPVPPQAMDQRWPYPDGMRYR